nr:unnamed protein product [Callosobruchus analis]
MGHRISNALLIAHLNVRSLFTNFDNLNDLVHKGNYDVLGISESWLNANIPSCTVEIPGYKFFRQDREGRGGGVAFYVKSHFSCRKIHIEVSIEELEYLFLEIKIGRFAMAIGVLYRPPRRSANQCIDTLDSILSCIMSKYDNVAILGDINVDMMNTRNIILDCFNSYSFSQLITEPTRVTDQSATLIDPIFVSEPVSVISSGLINADMISDHHLVFCKLRVPKHTFKQKYITYRDFKNFDEEKFYADLLLMPWYNIIYLQSIDEKVAVFAEYIHLLFNKHAPTRTVRVSKPHCPWLTDVVKMIMHLRDMALREFKLNRTEEKYNYYKKLRNLALASLRREKQAYLETLYSQKNQSKFWKTLKRLNIQKCGETHLPEHLKDANAINDHFISVYKQSLGETETIRFYSGNTFSDNQKFQFSMAHPNDIKKAILSIKSESIGTDNISLTMIKMCLPTLLPYITHIINSCLESGYFPKRWREAIVIPVPKNSSPSNFNDLRPISLLPLFSKLLEKIVQTQLVSYCNELSIIPSHQSGFRAGHSTNTALLNITDNIFRALDKKMASVLISLDFSKAFDTIDHGLLCAKLQYYGLDETSIHFFRSYLSDRVQRVKIEEKLSCSKHISSGVPQGSILGPLLFTIYTADFHTTLSHSFISSYADDTQLIHHFDPQNTTVAVDMINEDIECVVKYTKNHNLSLNPTKCNAMLFCPKKFYDHLKNNLNIKIIHNDLQFIENLKVLGVTLDEHLRFSSHVANILKHSYLRLKILYSSKYVLSSKTKRVLCETLVMSVVRYCDILYYPCLDSITKLRLQKVQNSCCRFICGLRKYDHISDKIREMGWLPIEKVVKLHYIIFVHKLVTTSIPYYLFEKLISRRNSHDLNLRHRDNYTIPRFFTALFTRSFSYNAVKLYNQVNNEYKTCSLLTFKKKLKQLLLVE